MRLLLLVTLLLSACSFVKTQKDDGSPLFDHAQTFDAFVQGKLDPEAKKQLQRSCAGADNSENIFCFSVNRSHLLFKREAQRTRIAKPAPERITRPTPLRLSPKGNLINPSAVKRASVDNLLKALHELPLEQVEKIGQQAVKLKCPNSLASATAATLEDGLPNASLHGLIAKLYAQAGRCAPRRSNDREHFYSRSALFFMLDNNDTEAIKWLEQAPSRDAFSGRVLYWLARLYKKTGSTEKASAVLARLYREFGFSFHATAASLQNDFDLASTYLDKELNLETRSRRSPAANALIQQAEVLSRYDFNESAATLAYWAVQSYRKLEPLVRLHLSDLGSPYLKVETVPLILLYNKNLIARKTLELSYPKAYFEMFEKYDSEVDPYLLQALAHKESKFNPRAVSPANAQGILQLNPTTALDLSGGREQDLFDLGINLGLGARYLSKLLDHYNGRTYLALSAYNAGESQADKWKARYPTDDLVLFIDLLSYRETRNYVGFVLRNYYWYRRLYEGEGTSSLKRRLGL